MLMLVKTHAAYDGYIFPLSFTTTRLMLQGSAENDMELSCQIGRCSPH